MVNHAEWPFDQPRNCAALTTRQVIQLEEPILLVSHDADDHGWQFLGRTVTTADGRIVSLEEIVRLDPTVIQVSDLLPGWQATRKSPTDRWNRIPPKAR